MSQPALKKAKYSQKYLKKYDSIPGIKSSQKGDGYAYCTYCRKDFSIASSGMFDISRHKSGPSHASCEKKAKENVVMKNFLTLNNNDTTFSTARLNITKEEAMFTDLIVDLNLLLSAADTITKTVKKAFPDSEIARGNECSRSKTIAMVNTMAKIETATLEELLKIRPYSLSTDGSNDQRDKQFPVVITTIGES